MNKLLPFLLLSIACTHTPARQGVTTAQTATPPTPFASYSFETQDRDGVLHDTGNLYNGTYSGPVVMGVPGVEGTAALFGAAPNTAVSYAFIPDDPAFSIEPDGLTISVWIALSDTQFLGTNAKLCTGGAIAANYISFLNKNGNANSTPKNGEWLFRLYPDTAIDTCGSRVHRLSAYAFSPNAGLGSGAYHQELLSAGEWHHVVATLDSASTPGARVRIYFDGVATPPSSGDLYSTYSVVPGHGTAPVRIGAATLESNPLWVQFRGAIDELNFYRGVHPEVAN